MPQTPPSPTPSGCLLCLCVTPSRPRCPAALRCPASCGPAAANGPSDVCRHARARAFTGKWRGAGSPWHLHAWCSITGVLRRWAVYGLGPPPYPATFRAVPRTRPRIPETSCLLPTPLFLLCYSPYCPPSPFPLGFPHRYRPTLLLISPFRAAPSTDSRVHHAVVRVSHPLLYAAGRSPFFPHFRPSSIHHVARLTPLGSSRSLPYHCSARKPWATPIGLTTATSRIPRPPTSPSLVARVTSARHLPSLLLVSLRGWYPLSPTFLPAPALVTVTTVTTTRQFLSGSGRTLEEFLGQPVGRRASARVWSPTFAGFRRSYSLLWASCRSSTLFLRRCLFVVLCVHPCSFACIRGEGIRGSTEEWSLLVPCAPTRLTVWLYKKPYRAALLTIPCTPIYSRFSLPPSSIALVRMAVQPPPLPKLVTPFLAVVSLVPPFLAFASLAGPYFLAFASLGAFFLALAYLGAFFWVAVQCFPSSCLLLRRSPRPSSRLPVWRSSRPFFSPFFRPFNSALPPFLFLSLPFGTSLLLGFHFGAPLVPSSGFRFPLTRPFCPGCRFPLARPSIPGCRFSSRLHPFLAVASLSRVPPFLAAASPSLASFLSWCDGRMRLARPEPLALV